MLFIHETFLVYQLETFKNCKEVKHIMIMTTAITYIFFILCDIWSTVENFFQKILSTPEKIHSPLFTHSPPIYSKSASLPFFAKIENFSGAPQQIGGWGGRTLWLILIQVSHSSKIILYFCFILCWQLKNIMIKIQPILFKYANKINEI